MLKNLIVLPDGTEIFSGTAGKPALKQVTLTQQVNVGTELTLGSVCAGRLEAEIFTYGGDVAITPGMELTLYKVAEDGERTKIGLFTAEKTLRPSANVFKVIAYDRICWLEKDLDDWLSSLSGWPYSLEAFAHMVCQACNLNLVHDTLPNGNYPVEKFSAKGITGRRLMQWVGQVCGRFCRATAQGTIELGWYTPRDITLTPTGAVPVLAGERAAYQIAPVDRVQIVSAENDLEVFCGTGSNCYRITGNYLLSGEEAVPMQAVARTLYEILHGVTYTPCKIKIAANIQIQPGDILSVAGANGMIDCMYVMRKTQTGYAETLECTGSPNRSSIK